MSVKWGEENDKICGGLFWSTLYGCVCFCLSVSVGTMALLRCWESQAPWCLACSTGVSRGTFGWIRWPLCPFQVWLLHSGASNMNLEAIKDGWIAGCPLPILPHSTQNPTGLWVLSINFEAYSADRAVISLQLAISSGLGILFLTPQSKIEKTATLTISSAKVAVAFWFTEWHVTLLSVPILAMCMLTHDMKAGLLMVLFRLLFDSSWQQTACSNVTLSHTILINDGLKIFRSPPDGIQAISYLWIRRHADDLSVVIGRGDRGLM